MVRDSVSGLCPGIAQNCWTKSPSLALSPNMRRLLLLRSPLWLRIRIAVVEQSRNGTRKRKARTSQGTVSETPISGGNGGAVVATVAVAVASAAAAATATAAVEVGAGVATAVVAADVAQVLGSIEVQESTPSDCDIVVLFREALIDHRSGVVLTHLLPIASEADEVSWPVVSNPPPPLPPAARCSVSVAVT